MLNAILSKKVQGQKHPGGWGIVEHQIPSIKMLFKTNTKITSILVLDFYQRADTISKPKKTKSRIQPRNCTLLYRTWWGAASPILNDTPVVYTTYNRTRIRNVYIYIYIYISTQSFWTGTKVIRRKHIVQPTGFGACSSTCCQWDGEDVPAPWERSNSQPPVRVQKSSVNPFI